MSAVARRYARAATALAEDLGGLKGVEELARGVAAFRAAYHLSAELREVLRNPALRGARSATLADVVRRLALSRSGAGLIRMLAERDRIDQLDEVAAEIEAIADERAARARAHVVSAIPLTEAQEQRLARALEQRFGRPVALNIEIDPAILGGLVCRVGDVTMDSSLRRQLQSLRERLLA